MINEIDKLNIVGNSKLPYKFNFTNLEDKIIEQWYDFVFQYINNKPDLKNLKELFSKKIKLFKEDLAEQISEEVKKILIIQRSQKYLKGCTKILIGRKYLKV